MAWFWQKFEWHCAILLFVSVLFICFSWLCLSCLFVCLGFLFGWQIIACCFLHMLTVLQVVTTVQTDTDREEAGGSGLVAEANNSSELPEQLPLMSTTRGVPGSYMPHSPLPVPSHQPSDFHHVQVVPHDLAQAEGSNSSHSVDAHNVSVPLSLSEPSAAFEGSPHSITLCVPDAPSVVGVEASTLVSPYIQRPDGRLTAALQSAIPLVEVTSYAKVSDAGDTESASWVAPQSPVGQAIAGPPTSLVNSPGSESDGHHEQAHIPGEPTSLVSSPSSESDGQDQVSAYVQCV